ncbi:metal-dependent phosphohydrolase [Deinococcus aerolatus]|uniref:Metal-dependent phosphohydrolase n=1 Tax=Deinococcus aerolatus TaxID=522487 RepID=A0ABQ2G2I6_9DEIO|nr:HD domain-containing protein [Deinococcus aerolatus]GGL71616.1 metal-dependent phosphohydrolase [Deinococcus aerolatus]
MRLPDMQTAEHLLPQTAEMNPGAWVQHSQYVALAARHIAAVHPRLDPTRAYTLGLLHDIGRRTGPNRDRHLLDGHDFLLDLGYTDAARIALTHAFVIPDMATLQGEWDGTPEEWQRLGGLVACARQTEEDRLIQLCGLLALASGFCTVEERLVDIALRYTFHARTPDQWHAKLNVKVEFDRECGVNIYRLLPGLMERLLA